MPSYASDLGARHELAAPSIYVAARLALGEGGTGMMTETIMVAIEVLREVCADNEDALMWLDEIDADLDGRPSPSAEQAGDEQAKLAAWNAWAAQ